MVCWRQLRRLLAESPILSEAPRQSRVSGALVRASDLPFPAPSRSLAPVTGADIADHPVRRGDAWAYQHSRPSPRGRRSSLAAVVGCTKLPSVPNESLNQPGKEFSWRRYPSRSAFRHW